MTVIVTCGRVTESTRAKIDFYSERLKQLAGTSFTKLAAPPPAQAEAEQPPTVSSSSKEEDKENAFEEKTFDDNKISESKDVEQCAKTKPPPSEAGQQAELCVPDSSVAEEAGEEEAEQLSSGSVDEELLEEDTDQGDTKTAEPEPEGHWFITDMARVLSFSLHRCKKNQTMSHGATLRQKSATWVGSVT